MTFHHVAIATRDLEATHGFYSDACGFDLVHVEVIPYLQHGWARHLFYDTGGGEMLAVWDLHDDGLPDFDPAISTGLGLPSFVNHVAFAAPDLGVLDTQKDRWVSRGFDVVRIDHGWCTSIYANDPNGIMVEFCCTTRAFGDTERRQALDRLATAAPPVDRTPPPTDFFVAADAERALR